MSHFCLLIGLVACAREPLPAKSDRPLATTEASEEKTEQGRGAPSDPCPTLSPPAPGFCSDGKIVARKDGDCVVGYDCVKSQAENEPCPTLSPPAPGFCPDGKIVPRKDGDCVVGHDCVTP